MTYKYKAKRWNGQEWVWVDVTEETRPTKSAIDSLDDMTRSLRLAKWGFAIMVAGSLLTFISLLLSTSGR